MAFLFSLLPCEVEDIIQKNVEYRRDFDTVLFELQFHLTPDCYENFYTDNCPTEDDNMDDEYFFTIEDTFETITDNNTRDPYEIPGTWNPKGNGSYLPEDMSFFEKVNIR
jgi:hypothetical protein